MHKKLIKQATDEQLREFIDDAMSMIQETHHALYEDLEKYLYKEVYGKYDNLDILYYDTLDLNIMMEDLYSKYSVDRLTIQSGGSMNGLFVRNDLIDYVDIVIAPILIGGKDVPTLVDGESINDGELGLLRPLELMECNRLNDSYIELKYRVRR